MLACEAIAKYITDLGVDVQFGVLGEGTIAVVTALEERGVPYVAARREDAAVSMADGWARRSGQVGFCSVTSGPGLTNTVTALIEAVRRGTPLVLLTALTPRALVHHPQRVAAEALVAATGAGWREASGRDLLAEDVAGTFRAAMTECRPWVLAVPAELLYEVVDDALLSGTLPEALAEPLLWPLPAAAPDPDTVADIVELLRAARRPLILAGHGAWRSGAEGALVELAGRVGADLATTLLGKGLFWDHPRHLGIMGGFATPTGAQRVQEADVVLAFGCSLNRWTTLDGDLLEGAAVVHCDADPASLGRWVQPHVGIVADARRCAEALLAACEVAGLQPVSMQPVEAVAAAPRENRDEAPLQMTDVIAQLATLVPETATLAFDPGHAVIPLVTHLTIASPAQLIFPVHLGAIGLGLGCAIGAAVAARDEWTFLFTGDGALQMALQELDSVRRLALPLVIVVLDDGAYGAEVQYCAARGLPDHLSYLDNPDFVAVAAAFGLEAQALTSLDDLRVIKDIVNGPREPVLLRVPIDPRPMSDWYRDFTSGIVRIPGWTGGQ